MVRHKNHAMNPEKFTPRICATPVRRPIAARRPIVENTNGFWLPPRTAARTFLARGFPCRIACCAVGGEGRRVLGSGTTAQSPKAHTPGHPGTSMYSLTTSRPRSFLHGSDARIGLGEVPAVHTNVSASIAVPSLN